MKKLIIAKKIGVYLLFIFVLSTQNVWGRDEDLLNDSADKEAETWLYNFVAARLRFFGTATNKMLYPGGPNQITALEEATIEIAFKDPPEVIFHSDEYGQYFKFEKRIQPSEEPIKVVFEQPSDSLKEDGVEAVIPRFKCQTLEPDYFLVREFIDYGEGYRFRFKCYDGWIVELECFSGNSEHHIYGTIKLFGIQFDGDRSNPLVFKLIDDKYVYIQGKGFAAMPEGEKITFGE